MLHVLTLTVPTRRPQPDKTPDSTDTCCRPRVTAAKETLALAGPRALEYSTQGMVPWVAKSELAFDLERSGRANGSHEQQQC